MACVVDTANQPELQSSPMAFSASNMLIPASMSEYIAANPSGQRGGRRSRNLSAPRFIPNGREGGARVVDILSWIMFRDSPVNQRWTGGRSHRGNRMNTLKMSISFRG